MARKDLLKGLMDAAPADTPRAAVPPRPAKGAIGAVSQSIAELRDRALIEVPADLIDDAGLKDRLDEDDGIAQLAASIEEYGQQVPVLLRHSPNVEGRYEIVYGRRRVAALKSLGRPVRAMVRDLNTRDLIVTQGQENAARKDLSFIEKANFAAQMVEQGFERKVICDALHIDKTVISRMLSIVEALPSGLIPAIGAAPSVGRDRWLALTERAKGRETDEVCALVSGETSDDRFAAVFAALAPKKDPKPAQNAPAQLKGAHGKALGEAKSSTKGAQIKLTDPEFSGWLVDNIEEIHRLFLEKRGE
jgi:plasmid partitioning protein RepB